MKPGPVLQCGPGLHYSTYLRIQTYTEPIPLNMENLPQNIREYTDLFTVCVFPDRRIYLKNRLEFCLEMQESLL